MSADVPSDPAFAAPELHKRERLSSSLRGMLGNSQTTSLTLDGLMEQTEGRGLYLVMILLSLPFLTPIPLPGFSNVVGPVISLLAFRLAFRLPPRLPKCIGTRQISRHRLHAFIAAGAWILQKLERLARPRFSGWLEWRAIRFFNALLLVLMGLLLALPIPPVLPFTNSLPCWAIIITALAMMEADGVLIFLGYAIGLGTLIYLTLFAGVVLAGIGHLFHHD